MGVEEVDQWSSLHSFSYRYGILVLNEDNLVEFPDVQDYGMDNIGAS
jgi:hypothetical protein